MKQAAKDAIGKTPRERIIDAARELFGSKGFHSTTTAELASMAAVSMGQIYRHFSSKDDIILTIVEENVCKRVARMNSIFDAVQRGECSMFEALEAIASMSLQNQDEGLSYEILAESRHNPSVAERLGTLIASYRSGVQRLAILTSPNCTPEELEAYVSIMMACFIGLGHSVIRSRTMKSGIIARHTATLLMRALGQKGAVADEMKPS